jgi:hypothetical protein
MKLKYIQKEINRHGNVTYYFRRAKNFARIRLPDDPSSDGFKEEYQLALNEPGTMLRAAPETFEQKRRNAVESALRKSLNGAKQRARQRNRECDITLEWLFSEVERNEFKCALTGIPFFSPTNAASLRNPYAPSIDRVDSASGYTRDNVRVVIFAINIMLSDWGQETFERVARFYRSNIMRTPYARTESGCGPLSEPMQRIQSLRKGK